MSYTTIAFLAIGVFLCVGLSGLVVLAFSLITAANTITDLLIEIRDQWYEDDDPSGGDDDGEPKPLEPCDCDDCLDFRERTIPIAG